MCGVGLCFSGGRGVCFCRLGACLFVWGGLVCFSRGRCKLVFQGSVCVFVPGLGVFLLCGVGLIFSGGL